MSTPGTTSAASTVSTTTTQVYRVYIRTTAEAIWQAITDPEWTNRYGYTGYTHYDLRPGGKLDVVPNPEFKAQAVKLITEQGKSLAEVARDLDLGESMLRAWKQALARGGGQAFPGKGNPPALEEELRRLRAENKRLTMERDILKKATAFFARESS